MKIRWLGHSCFLMTTEAGNTLITDPYNAVPYAGTLLYDPVDQSADVVTMSHNHSDHGNVAAVGGTPVVVTAPGRREAAGFLISGVATFHDTQAGAQRGDNIVFCMTAEGVTVCHLGDLGHELSPRQVEEIGPVDVLLIPVGGTFTIDAAGATRVWQQLSPRVAIPMHFRNDKCAFNIDGVEGFLSGKPDVERPDLNEITLIKENLPAGQKIVVLEPAN